MKTDGPRIRDELKEIEQKLSQPGLDKKQQETLESLQQSCEAQLKPPGRDFAGFMLDNWKFQRHLYDRFGGNVLEASVGEPSPRGKPDKPAPSRATLVVQRRAVATSCLSQAYVRAMRAATIDDGHFGY